MNHQFTEPQKLLIALQTAWIIFAAFAPMALFFGAAAWGVMRLRHLNRTNRKP